MCAGVEPPCGHRTGPVTAPSWVARLVRWFAVRRMTWLTDVLQAVTWLGDSTVVFPLAVVADLCWRRRRGDWWRSSCWWSATWARGAMFNAVKFLVARARPGADMRTGAGGTAAGVLMFCGVGGEPAADMTC